LRQKSISGNHFSLDLNLIEHQWRDFYFVGLLGFIAGDRCLEN